MLWISVVFLNFIYLNCSGASGGGESLGPLAGLIVMPILGSGGRGDDRELHYVSDLDHAVLVGMLERDTLTRERRSRRDS